MSTSRFGPEGPKMKMWVALLRYGGSSMLVGIGLVVFITIWTNPRTKLLTTPSKVCLYGFALMFLSWGLYWFLRTMRYRPGVFADEWSITDTGYQKSLSLLYWLSWGITAITALADYLRWA